MPPPQHAPHKQPVYHNPTVDFRIFLAMIALLVVPAALTLGSVTVPREVVTAEGSSPYGYTWSLLVFLLPVLALGWWFLRHPSYALERRAFWITIGFFTVAGLTLDMLLGNTFFTFPNSGATLGIHLPGYDFYEGAWRWNVPIEELGFYGFGSLFMLLFYIWADLFWFGAYSDDIDRSGMANELSRLVQPSYPAALGGLAVLGLGILYKKYGPHPYQDGFPAYFTVLVIAYILPTFMFFRTVKPFINWRAFSMTLMLMWLMSVFWEATLGVPYQWWGYRDEYMLGIFIAGWSNLPIEEPLLWSSAAWGTMLLYDLVRIRQLRRTT